MSKRDPYQWLDYAAALVVPVLIVIFVIALMVKYG